MIQKININKLGYFHDKKRLDKLNSLVEIHTRLSPELLMQTGCSFQEAMQILFVLVHLYVANPYLLVYIIDDPEAPIEKRPLSMGLPTLPYIFPDGETVVEDKEKLFFGFEFDLVSNNIEFEV